MSLLDSFFYGRFLSAKTMNTPTTMITMIMAIASGIKYRSAIVGAGVAAGVGVACALSAMKAVSADEP